MRKTVRDVMHRAPITVGPEASFKEIARVMADREISALPVLDTAERVVGIVSEADLIVRDEDVPRPHLIERPSTHAARRKAQASNAADLMTAPAIVVGPETSLAEAATIMRRSGVKRLPVCDTDHRLLGIVSRIDLVREFVRADDAISDEVTQVMLSELSIPHTEVRVGVHNGVVSLEGTLEHEAELQMVVDRVRRVPGVVDVEARLRWTDREVSHEPRVVPTLGSWARN